MWLVPTLPPSQMVYGGPTCARHRVRWGRLSPALPEPTVSQERWGGWGQARQAWGGDVGASGGPEESPDPAWGLGGSEARKGRRQPEPVLCPAGVLSLPPSDPERLSHCPSCTARKWPGQTANPGLCISQGVPSAPCSPARCVGVSQGEARQSRGNCLCPSLQGVWCARLEGSRVWAVETEAGAPGPNPLAKTPSRGAVGLRPHPAG